MERAVLFYFPPLKWKAPVNVIPDRLGLLEVCVIFILNTSIGNFCIYSDH